MLQINPNLAPKVAHAYKRLFEEHQRKVHKGGKGEVGDGVGELVIDVSFVR